MSRPLSASTTPRRTSSPLRPGSAPMSRRPVSGKKKTTNFNTPEEPEIPIEEKYEKAKLKIQTLQLELLNQIEQTNRANTDRYELKQRIEYLKADLEQGKQDNNAVSAEMTRQYKSMQEDLIKIVNSLEQENLELREQLEMTHLILEETKKEKERQLAEKDAIIADQARKMEHMALEFADMLKETLEKMGERIEEAAKHAPSNNLLSANFAAKLQEFNIRIT